MLHLLSQLKGFDEFKSLEPFTGSSVTEKMKAIQ